LNRAKIGHLEDPHRSATLIVQVPTLSRGNSWEITGPGVKDFKTIQLGLTTNWDKVRAERNAEYPLGLDILLVEKGGKLMALPRTTQMRRK
jgi:alpha-D-ribose 1-methylphosphonate 5-triphosphate synthase subunit PhnH